MSIFDNVAYGAARARHRGARASASWSRWWSRRSSGPASTTRSRTTSTTRRWRSRAASSSGSASRARSRSRPEVLLLDEPCSALDPLSTAVIEELIVELRSRDRDRDRHPQPPAGLRVADRVAFMYLGDLVEYGAAEQVFGAPRGRAHARVRQRGLRLRRAACVTLAGRRRWRCAARSPPASRPRSKSAAAGRARREELLKPRRASTIKQDKPRRQGRSATTVLADANGIAVVGRAAQRLGHGPASSVPISIEVMDAKGKTRVHERRSPASSRRWSAMPGDGARRGRSTWVNDQVLRRPATPKSVEGQGRRGAGAAAAGRLPEIEVVRAEARRATRSPGSRRRARSINESDDRAERPRLLYARRPQGRQDRRGRPRARSSSLKADGKTAPITTSSSSAIRRAPS